MAGGGDDHSVIGDRRQAPQLISSPMNAVGADRQRQRAVAGDEKQYAARAGQRPKPVGKAGAAGIIIVPQHDCSACRQYARDAIRVGRPPVGEKG